MKLSQAEWQIMNALWDEHPATARQIAARLPEQVNWAYTTIKTMLTRLVEKQAVRERKQGNASLYDPILSRRQARSSALKSLVNQAFDGAFGPLMHFLFEQQDLTAKERTQIIQILQEHNNPKRNR
ncbi:MAG: BlaI/MecI/CopY family transcriptional regulator [Sedimentisphaerales bacterium]|nr:BlaI/MecI/CopY family transcriptional regulator [Sedimentisphaerales bacterium]